MKDFSSKNFNFGGKIKSPKLSPSYTLIVYLVNILRQYFIDRCGNEKTISASSPNPLVFILTFSNFDVNVVNNPFLAPIFRLFNVTDLPLD